MADDMMKVPAAARRETMNQVRQILMNELGLSRELVREMMTQIVTEVVYKKLRVMVDDGMIARVVGERLDLICRENAWGRDAIKGMVVKEAEKQVTEFVKTRLRITAVESVEVA